MAFVVYGTCAGREGVIMRALILEEVGTYPVLRTRDRQVVGPGQARIRILAAALNHRDVYISQGQYPGIQTPIILGSDGCGMVEECPESTRWEGQRVIFYPGADWGDDDRVQGPDYTILGLPTNGTFCDEMCLPIENIYMAPAHLTDEQAAALPLAGVTAWRALVTRGDVGRGDRVLITGIGGGVSLMAAQLAVAHGAEVYVTSGSAAKIDRARKLGVQDGVLYTEPGWGKALQTMVPEGFDVIVDGAGGEGFGNLVRVLGPAGRLVFYGGTRGKWPAILPQHLFFKQVSILASTMGSPREFGALLQFVEEKGVVPTVDRIFNLEEGGAAFGYLESGAQMGKVVIKP